MKMKTILVNAKTRLKDLKEGDLVITAELHRVKKIEGRNCIEVVDVEPACSVCKPASSCDHRFIKELGWGQHSIAKVVRIK